ncbi:hypothetical protein AF332_13385 [Sporosarcina globispora]|uniref:PD-(D/E)XK endonuclease-like domain-containing protein n=1 Tax=Sporosarcina globispora TaxID=1459 RepID=A0A0M0GD98_SPOGL|nr:hypothetical protein [Sporosarcina globispora]KON87728.1 hypothetical protein AF332_13385 [Sporosarcina globispora]
MIKYPQVSVRTMTDQNLTDFIRCPYKFYYTHIEKKKHPLGWRQAIQHIINKVVSSYFQLPKNQRTPANVLQLIDQYWGRLELGMFDTKLQYYMAAAAITDGLMTNLSSESDIAQPLFLYEKFKMNLKELDVDLSLTFDVAEWQQDSFIVKKFLVDADVQMLELYCHLTVVFSEKVFGIRPARIEVMTLIDGEKHVFNPDTDSLEAGLNYLQLMKNLLEDTQQFSDMYNVNECPACPFQGVCDRDEKIETKHKFLS